MSAAHHINVLRLYFFPDKYRAMDTEQVIDLHESVKAAVRHYYGQQTTCLEDIREVDAFLRRHDLGELTEKEKLALAAVYTYLKNETSIGDASSKTS